MARARTDRTAPCGAVAAVVALVLVGALWTLAGTVTSGRTAADHRVGAAPVEQPHHGPDSGHRTDAVRPGARFSIRTDPGRLPPRLLATWAAAGLLVSAGSWWTRIAPLDRLGARGAPRVSRHPRGPPA